MPLIEWICVAGLPIFICITKQSMQWRCSSDDNDSQSMMSVTTCADTSIIFDNDSFQWSLLILFITSILSLVTILLFGDTSCNNRGAGIAMGSNLVPLHYMAYIISTTRVGRVENDDDSCHQTTEQEQCTSVAEGRAIFHLEFASMSGLAFVISFAWIEWSRYNHRKYNNCRRLDRGVNGRAQKNGQCSNSDGKNHEHSINSLTSMQNCWKIYAALLLFRCTISHNINTAIIGSLHIVLIFLYNRRPSTMTTNDVTWQVAFTPGEYMVVSTFFTSLVGEFILQYSYSGMSINTTSLLFNNSLSIHLVVAHAGLVGCLVGVTFSSMMMKKLASLPSFCSNTTMRGKELAASLITVVGITIGCLEMALNSQQLNEIYCGVEPTTCSANIDCSRIPRCVIWLVFFLSSKSVQIGLISVRRTMVLIYWATVLAVCIPIASRFTLWITAASKNDSLTRKQRVVIARKYFHLVAILLFAPITYLDPDMMSLSYAIAIALLIVIEMVRGWMVTNDDKIETVSGAPSLNDFYLSFMDEKDSSASGGGIAVTHIALIMGCAFPCWVYQLLQPLSEASLSCDDKMLALLPYLGLVVLGIGDSVGAICGIKFGRHHWPSSTRTLEGSVCMFLSMVLVILSIASNIASQHNSNILQFVCPTSVTMFVMTLFEASTSQTDNLCLPIAGSTLMLLLGDGICR